VTQDNIVKFAEPGTFEDPLTEVLRSGARKLLAQAIEAERSDRSRCIDSDRHPDTCAARWAAFRCDALFPEEGEQLVADCTAPAMH
jgi:hypothetical protein